MSPHRNSWIFWLQGRVIIMTAPWQILWTLKKIIFIEFTFIWQKYSKISWALNTTTSKIFIFYRRLDSVSPGRSHRSSSFNYRHELRAGLKNSWGFKPHSDKIRYVLHVNVFRHPVLKIPLSFFSLLGNIFVLPGYFLPSRLQFTFTNQPVNWQYFLRWLHRH